MSGDIVGETSLIIGAALRGNRSGKVIDAGAYFKQFILHGSLITGLPEKSCGVLLAQGIRLTVTHSGGNLSAIGAGVAT